MNNIRENISDYLLLALLLMVIAGGLFILWYLWSLKRTAQKKKSKNAMECHKAKADRWEKNLTDYFWSDAFRWGWIMLFFLGSIGLSLVLATTTSLIISLVLFIIMSLFLMFSAKSFYAFEGKAKEALAKFETEVEEAMKKEVSFTGDNIQVFSDEDDEFDTAPQIFKFPVKNEKIIFPPFSGKKSIIIEKKVEFLILSREYFSICQNGSTFNLLNPAINEKKGCVEKPGGIGECHEFYYSQMRNVKYDGQGIRIIYSDGQDDAFFKCAKGPEQKKAMKALQEKLRLTERQKLKKIEEHKFYEDLKDKRVQHKEESTEESTDVEKENSDKENTNKENEKKES